MSRPERVQPARGTERDLMTQPVTPAPKRVLITGAAGCVGQYLVDEFLANTPHHLVLLVRDKRKLPFDSDAEPRVSVIEADMVQFETYREKLGHIDAALLAAAIWGGDQAFALNRDANLAVTDYVAAQPGGGRVLYFATGSVIDAKLDMLPASHELGTEYIRSKYELVEEIEKRADKVELVGIYPTLIVGGGDGKPMSHFAKLLLQIAPYGWAGRFFRAEAKFHFVHARDIARVSWHLVDAPLADLPEPRRLVQGTPAISANDFLMQFARYMGYSLPFGIPIREWFAEWIIKTFRIELSPWDRYCMHHRDLSYEKVYGPADFGLPVHCPDLPTALAQIGVPKRK